MYLGLLGILIGLIIFTPLLIKDGFSIFDEEIIEVIISTSLFIVGFVIYSLYRREIEKHRKSLNETLNYIGNVNLQINNIESIFNEMKKFPESKSDYKNIQKFLAEKTLGIINAEWVLFRIIETQNIKTLSEHFQSRGKVALIRHEISNKNLVIKKSCPDCSVIESNQDNFNVQAYCVIPKEKISENQRVLIKAIVNNLVMMYLIFASGYYKNGNNGGGKARK